MPTYEYPRPALTCDVVVLRFFGGLSFKEIATYLKVYVSTIEKDWNFARSWLRVALDE